MLSKYIIYFNTLSNQGKLKQVFIWFVFFAIFFLLYGLFLLLKSKSTSIKKKSLFKKFTKNYKA